MVTPLLARDVEALTVEDWFTREDIPERAELFQGVLVMAPAPDPLHQVASIRLATALDTVALRSGGLALAAPTGVALAEDIGFEPDVLYLAPGTTHLLQRRGVMGAPTICVEVLSPGTRRYDRLTKLPAYLDKGVAEVWLVDVAARVVEVHTAGQPVRSCRFGEPIPSSIVDVGTARLETVPDHLES